MSDLLAMVNGASPLLTGFALGFCGAWAYSQTQKFVNKIERYIDTENTHNKGATS